MSRAFGYDWCLRLQCAFAFDLFAHLVPRQEGQRCELNIVGTSWSNPLFPECRLGGGVLHQIAQLRGLPTLARLPAARLDRNQFDNRRHETYRLRLAERHWLIAESLDL